MNRSRVLHSLVGLVVLLAGCSETTGPRTSGLRFVVQPSYTIARGSVNPVVTVEAVDGRGRVVSGFSDAVVVTLGANPGGGSLSGTTSAVALGGVARFPDLTIDRIGVGYTLVADAAGMSATSSAFTVAPQLVFSVQPANAVAGAPLAPAVQVSALDATGAVLSDFTDDVTLSLGAHADLASLTGIVSVAAVAGVATFSGVSVGLGTSGYTLTAVSPRFAPAGALAPVTSDTFSVACVSRCWTLEASMPVAPASVAAVAINSLVYVVGASRNHQAAAVAYDPAADTWAAKAAPPLLTEAGDAVGINGVFYAVSGYAPLSAMAYDPAADRWTVRDSTGCYPYVGAYGVAAVNGILYAVGGGDINDVGSAACSYDPVANQWSASTMNAVPMHTDYPGVGAANGVLYVIGGADYFGAGLTAVQAYDAATNTWTQRAPMPTGRSMLAVGLLDGVLYAVGGVDSNATPLGTVEAYDPASDTWTSKPSLPTPRAGLAVAVVNGLLFAIGGETYAGPTGVVEAYKP